MPVYTPSARRMMTALACVTLFAASPAVLMAQNAAPEPSPASLHGQPLPQRIYNEVVHSSMYVPVV